MSADPQPAAGAASGPARADARRESGAFQRAILECVDYAIISTTPDGVIRTFNRAAERMLGYRAEEVIGRVTPEIIHDCDEVARRAAKLAEELGRPVPAGFEAFVAKTRLGLADEQEWTYIRKDGSRFPVQLSVTAMRDEAGQIIGFMGIAHDIWRRREAQARVGQLAAQLDRRVRERTAQVAASEERLRLAQQAARVGTFEWNIQTGINTWSPELEALYGLPPGGFLGTQPAWERLVHPDDLARAKAQVQRAFDTNDTSYWNSPVEGSGFLPAWPFSLTPALPMNLCRRLVVAVRGQEQFEGGSTPLPATRRLQVAGTGSGAEIAALGPWILSRWAREERLPLRTGRDATPLRARADFLPLPAGEGRGEGERTR